MKALSFNRYWSYSECLLSIYVLVLRSTCLTDQDILEATFSISGQVNVLEFPLGILGSRMRQL